MDVTWLDSNSWLLELTGQRVLVDPWLVGVLMFGNAPWLFRGEHPVPRPIPENIDLILLSQGFPDHAHPETLQRLPKEIPVVGSPNAAKVAADLGFTQVTALSHGKSISHHGLEIKAIPGAPLGPTLVENGYILTEAATGLRLFYEPHGFHPQDLKAEAPVDVVITPMVDLALPLVGAILRGRQSALELADWLQPQVMLPTANAGEATYHGLLVSMLRVVGSVADVQQTLAKGDRPIQVLEPRVGKVMTLPLEPRSLGAPATAAQ